MLSQGTLLDVIISLWYSLYLSISDLTIVLLSQGERENSRKMFTQCFQVLVTTRKEFRDQTK
jgi:hypothetical protein